MGFNSGFKGLIGGLSLQVIFWVSRLPRLKGLFSSLSRELVKFFSTSIAQKLYFFVYSNVQTILTSHLCYSFFSLPRRRIWLLACIAISAAFTLRDLLFFQWIYFNPLKTGLHTHETRYTRRNLPRYGRTFLTLHYANIPKRTDSDWGVCSWPWQCFVLGKAEHPLFVNSNRCIAPVPVAARSKA